MKRKFKVSKNKKLAHETQRVFSSFEKAHAFKRCGKPIYDFIDPGLYLPESQTTWIPTPWSWTSSERNGNGDGAEKKAKFDGPIVNLDEERFPKIKIQLETVL